MTRVELVFGRETALAAAHPATPFDADWRWRVGGYAIMALSATVSGFFFYGAWRLLAV